MTGLASGAIWSSDIARPEITSAVRRGATRFLRQSGYAVISEMTFGSGRRADLVALRPDHDIWIIEIKSGLADFRVDAKWHEYSAYCDALAFAVTADFPVELIPEPVGLIMADAYGGQLVRAPERLKLAPARRKALVLAFAQLAASRLTRLEDPDFEPGF